MIEPKGGNERFVKEMFITILMVIVVYSLWTGIYYTFWKEKPKILTQPVNIMIKGKTIKMPYDSTVRVEVVESGVLIKKESATLGINDGVEKGVWSTTSIMIKGQPYVVLKLIPQPAERP